MNTLTLLAALVTMIPLCAQAAPMNLTEKELSYCEINDTLVNVTITDVCKTTNDALVGIKNICDETNLKCKPPVQYNTSMETDSIALKDRINGELQKLIGKLNPLNELCEVEEEKQSKGEDSLVNVCNVLKCVVKPLPLKVAQYLITEKCCWEKGCFYVPGKYMDFEAANMTQLVNQLHDSVNFLQVILRSVNKGTIDKEEIASGEDDGVFQ